MSQTFDAGDYLVFQLESGYGLLRILAIEGDGTDRVWHLRVYEELFPDVESAEQALAASQLLHATKPHLAMTDRAFDRTPTAKIGYGPLNDDELAAYRNWQQTRAREVFDRSLLLLLGMR